MPPLRERREDIPYLTAAFVKEFAERFGKPLDGISPGAERILMAGGWEGNVRELRNVLERACMMAEGRALTERDVEPAMPVARPAGIAQPGVAAPRLRAAKISEMWSAITSCGCSANCEATSGLPPRGWASAGERSIAVSSATICSDRANSRRASHA